MIKLNAGFSRKVGEPNYGSRGASVNVELELESGLISDPDALADRIHKLFNIARRSVDVELSGPAAGQGLPRTQSVAPGPASSAPNGNGTERQSNGQPAPRRSINQAGPRVATVSQLRAIRAIGQRQQIDVDRLAQQRCGVKGVDELTLPEASALIDELKASAPTSPNGGGR